LKFHSTGTAAKAPCSCRSLSTYSLIEACSGVGVGNAMVPAHARGSRASSTLPRCGAPQLLGCSAWCGQRRAPTASPTLISSSLVSGFEGLGDGTCPTGEVALAPVEDEAPSRITAVLARDFEEPEHDRLPVRTPLK